MKTRVEIKTRFWLQDEIALGPGKADLLEAIAQTGSISGAAKQLGMSYRRAWQLVDTMNRCFKEPLVESQAGGKQGGGAMLSSSGQAILKHYRALEAQLNKHAAQFARRIQARLQ